MRGSSGTSEDAGGGRTYEVARSPGRKHVSRNTINISRNPVEGIPAQLTYEILSRTVIL